MQDEYRFDYSKAKPNRFVAEARPTIVVFEDIARNLRAYFERARSGETIVVQMEDGSLIQIKAVTQEPPAHLSTLRPIGLCAGQFTVPDDFDMPLPDGVSR